MTFDVSIGAGYAVLYSVLVFFTILAIGTANYLSFLPDALTRCCFLKTTSNTADYFLSARNSAGSFAVAMSFFASGMGAWVVYGSTEMGANPQLSWLGVLGYSGASAFPAILICWLGPQVRAMSEDAFSTTDFGRKRYGRVMQVAIAIVSVFYMFIFIVAELTSISSVYALLVQNFSDSYSRSIAISLGAFTVFYTTLAGLPASIVTDKFQGVLMMFLVVVLLIAVTVFPENHVTREEFALASNFTLDGFMAAVTLFIAIACAELFNQGTWQRVWAAESVPAMRKGFLWGSALVFLLMMFFGVMGMIAYANDPEAYDSFEKFAFLAFFDLLEPLANGWHILVLLLVTALAASSIDSLQNALTCIFSADLVKIGWNPKWITRTLVVAINVPAIIMASKKYDVIALFLVADLVCATSVFPVFLGLQMKDKANGWLVAPTELGAFLGCVSGVVAVVINGLVNDVDGGLFEYFWLKNGAMCALCGSKTLVTFVITPAVSFVMTYAFSKIDVMVRGERARSPLIPIPFDKDDTVEGSGDEEEDNFDGIEDKETDEFEDDIEVVQEKYDESETQEAHEEAHDAVELPT